jgi:hypothetical protein
MPYYYSLVRHSFYLASLSVDRNPVPIRNCRLLWSLVGHYLGWEWWAKLFWKLLLLLTALLCCHSGSPIHILRRALQHHRSPEMARSTLRIHGLHSLHAIRSHADVCHLLGKSQPHSVLGRQRPMEGLFLNAQVLLFLGRVLFEPELGSRAVFRINPRLRSVSMAFLHHPHHRAGYQAQAGRHRLCSHN